MGISWLYFSSGIGYEISKSKFFGFLDTMLSLPALVIFGYGFAEGQTAMLKAGFYLFLIIWFVSFLTTFIILSIKENNKKIKSS